MYVAFSKGRYSAGFAVVDGRKLLGQAVFAAPDPDDLARSLHELHGRAHDILGTHLRECAGELRVALWENGYQGAAVGVARRAEGVLLAAAGAHGVPVKVFVKGKTVHSALQLDCPNKGPAIADAGAALLDQAPERVEARYAAAAALADG